MKYIESSLSRKKIDHDKTGCLLLYGNIFLNQNVFILVILFHKSGAGLSYVEFW